MRLFLLLLLGLPGLAQAQTAEIEFDLVRSRVMVRAEQPMDFAVDPDVLRIARHFAARCEMGEWTREDAKRFGAMLEPAREILAAAPRWVVAPLDLAPVSAWVLPGEEDLVLASHEVSYAHRGPSLDASEPPGDVLLIAPFVPGVDSLDDDPYDLLSPARGAVRSVSLIPRNDTTPASAATALAEDRPGLVWLRATPAQAVDYLPVIGRTTSLVWWTRADDETTPNDPSLVRANVVAWPGTMVLDLWPVEEPARAPFARTFVREIGAGAALSTALATARREQAAKGSVQTWAGWILVGDAGRVAPVRGPSWWQRLFQR